MRFRFTPRAEAEAEREQAWWREHRPDAPEVFANELAQAIGQIVRRPTAGAIYPSTFPDVVRRVLLTKTRNHVYFTVHEDEIVILSVWGAPRRRGPKL
ncbi:MAG: hypothetical protein KF795_28320 [Labilithrix sp.]|nr:hypothetical protein [Labilithrix sp.]